MDTVKFTLGPNGKQLGDDLPDLPELPTESRERLSAQGQASSGDPTPPPPDPFEPANLRIDQDFAASTMVQKLVLTIPVRKPGKEWFVRTHPDPAYHLATSVIELKDEREIYLVDRALRPALAAESTFGPRRLVTSVNRQGVVFVWALRLPGPDGKIDAWSRSALEAADLARDRWIRVTPNISLGAYDVQVAHGSIAKPEFPDLPLKEILRLAFRDKYISEPDHVVLRKLRGEL